jgi:excisionase family DNA binding protein
MSEALPITNAPEAITLSAPAVDKLLLSIDDLARLLGLSPRHLRRLDCKRSLPGRVTLGRRVLFQAEEVRHWVAAGCPAPEAWAALQRRKERGR